MIDCRLVEGDGEDDRQRVHSGAFHQDRDREGAGTRSEVQDAQFGFGHIDCL